MIRFKDYKVFFDRQKDGYGTEGGVFRFEDGVVEGYFGGTYTWYEDDECGRYTFVSRSPDLGATWSEPEKFAEELTKDPRRESVFLGAGLRTKAGTLIANGFHMVMGDGAERFYQNRNFRAYDLLIARKPPGADRFDIRAFPSGTFMGEQFMERGLQMPDGRLVYAMWGMSEPGQNWQCGVMLSDDDGMTWRYRQVGYEPDLAIRNRPDTPAGYNEQSLFLAKSGKLVSIIRGRDRLAMVEGSPKDTWFSRSESMDRGETWSKPHPVNVPSTGAAGIGLVLPDGSFLHACRVPYARDLLKLPEPELFGLHFARSFDEGLTWTTETILQHDPEGHPFDNHYNAMNGQFLRISPSETLYLFGHFDAKRDLYRILSVTLETA
jgi:hypothetical protein